MAAEFKDYFSNIIYINDTNFVDGFHLKNSAKYTQYYKDKFMK